MAKLSCEEEKIASNPWLWWRSLMPITETHAYFDHAAVAPLSAGAAEQIRRYAQQISELGDTVWPFWNQNSQILRQKAASLMHCDSSDICIVPNTTTGINLVAEGWPWQAGDSVVIPDGEFPSNLFPWLNQQSRGVEVRVVPRRDSAVLIDDLLDHVDETTRIIAVSWVGYATGYRIDIDELVRRAHQRGVCVFVDAIQGLGMYPLDLKETPVDFLAADGHKWLLGPEGVGVAMIRRDHVTKLRAGNVGWASVKNSHNYNEPKLDLREDASRFESGSANMVGIAALAASMDIFVRVKSAHGANAIADRVMNLADELHEKLRAHGAKSNKHDAKVNQSSIVNFQVPGWEPVRFREMALKENVVLSCRGTGIRASIHAYNNSADIDRLVEVVAKAQA